MNKKRTGIILIVVGTLLALIVGTVVYMQAEEAANLARQTPTTEVIVALADLPERAAIPSASVGIGKMPAEMVPMEASTKLENVVGKYPLTRIYKGEVMIQAKLADSTGKTGPSFTLKEGMVAATLTGNDLLTGTGAIRPGDRVDILLTLPLTRAAGATGSGGQSGTTLPPVTQTLVQNVEVLRVGSFQGTGQQEGAALGKGITFQVSHQDALAVKWAKDSGGVVDLVLRHPAEKEPVSTEAVTANYIFRNFKFVMPEPLQ